MNPVYQQANGNWWFRCPYQDSPIGPFRSEDRAYEARALHYPDPIKPTLTALHELDIEQAV